MNQQFSRSRVTSRTCSRLGVSAILVGLNMAGCSRTDPTSQSQSTTQSGNLVITATPISASERSANALTLARQRIGEKHRIDPALLLVKSVQGVNWPNACLGVVEPDQMCAQVITPGFRFVLENNQRTFTVHTDLDGRRAAIP